VTELELAPDAADLAAVGPFWAALLTGSPDTHRAATLSSPASELLRVLPGGADEVSLCGPGGWAVC
jgi:hypothetical protein